MIASFIFYMNTWRLKWLLDCWWSIECVMIDCTPIHQLKTSTIHLILYRIIMIWIWIVSSLIISHQRIPFKSSFNLIHHPYTLSTPPFHINTLNYLHSLWGMNDKKRDCLNECVEEVCWLIWCEEEMEIQWRIVDTYEVYETLWEDMNWIQWMSYCLLLHYRDNRRIWITETPSSPLSEPECG